MTVKTTPSGAPVTAWVEGPNGQRQLRVAAWNGNSWTSFGSAVATGNPTLWQSSLALDGSGSPVVAWTDGTTSYVSRWNGTSWAAVGPSFPGAGNVQIGVVSADPLTVSVFMQSGPQIQLTIQRWNGTAWNADTSRGLNDYAVGFADSVVGDGAGGVVVAWRGLRASGGSGDWDLVVDRWSGGTWARLGGVLNVNPTWGAGNPQLRVSGGVITASWSESFFRQPTSAYVKQWDGTTWQQLGTVSTVISGGPTLAVDATGVPFVGVYENGQVLVKNWTGSTWQTVGGNAAVADPSSSAVGVPALDINGTTAIGWIGAVSVPNQPLAYSVYVSRLDSTGGPPPTTTTAPTTTTTASTTTTTAPTTTTTTAPTTTTTTAPTTTTTAPTTTTTAPTTTTTAATTTTTAVAGNLVPNPSFEAPMLPTDYWGGRVARTTAAAHSGTYSLAQTVSSARGGWDLDADRSWDAPITAGRRYTATMWVRASSTVKVILYVDLLSGNGSYSDSAGSPTATLQPNTWTKLAVTFTAASGQAYGAMSANFSSATSGTVILYDDMSLVAS